jgi:hypothetical protein
MSGPLPVVFKGWNALEFDLGRVHPNDVHQPRSASGRRYIARKSTGPQRSQRFCHHRYGPRRARTVDVQNPSRAHPVH